MAPDLPVEDVHDLARLLMKARHIRIAIEEMEGVEFVFGLPLKHPPHLPGWILARRTGPRPRYHFAGAQLPWLGEHNVPDCCIPAGPLNPSGMGIAVMRDDGLVHQFIRHNYFLFRALSPHRRSIPNPRTVWLCHTRFAYGGQVPPVEIGFLLGSPPCSRNLVSNHTLDILLE